MWQWRRAKQGAVTLRENLYAADMGLAFQSWDAGHIERIRELLERHRRQSGRRDLRTFEWRYLFGMARPRETANHQEWEPRDLGKRHFPDGRLLATGAGTVMEPSGSWSWPYGP